MGRRVISKQSAPSAAGDDSARQGRGKIAALLMLAGAIVPAIWAPKSLVFTGLLLIGGIVCFFVKPRQTADA